MARTKLERDFQRELIKDVYSRLGKENTIITKLDPNHTQGIPDLLILHKDRWATLECKKSKNATKRPNQGHYVNRMNKMSYSSFIYPENREEVLNEMERSLEVKR